ncbi:hypothetical protein [Sphingomonas sp. GC_Shp_3]|uniref:hypothetical protein n=1 Tax=Sphingomonas sp. GC_Shp_3 TaxID=2937383 RepID=UPI00226AE9FE|nr:hypothetical protein [Sphingomonas sp. GC_Shp_3]
MSFNYRLGQIGSFADDPQAAAKLRARPAEQVVDGLNLAAMNRLGLDYSGPVPDGHTFVGSLAAYRAGRFAHVPVELRMSRAAVTAVIWVNLPSDQHVRF